MTEDYRTTGQKSCMYQTLEGRNHVCIKHYRVEIMYVSNTTG